jgi:hypothetical protein
MAMAQAIALLSDQKLAHYMHVSPKNVSLIVPDNERV